MTLTVGTSGTDLDVMDRDHRGKCGDTSRKRRSDTGGCWPHPVVSWSDESRNDSFLSIGDAADGNSSGCNASADTGITSAHARSATSTNSNSGTSSIAAATPDARTGRALRQSFKGDIGLTLFSPLVLENLASTSAAGSTSQRPTGRSACSSTAIGCILETPEEAVLATEPVRSRSDSDLNRRGDNLHVQGQDNTCARDKDNNEYQSCDIYADEPVPLAEEDADVLRSSPRLLTASQMRQIRDEGLHSTAQIMRWHRSYSLSRDGDSFRTMMEKCGGYRHTIIVCRTTDGDILGGYADEAWKLGGINSFFGSGRAFLFATRPDLSDEDKEWVELKSGGRRKGVRIADEGSNLNESEGQEHDCSKDPRIYVFPWTGTNTYSQVCSVESEQLAMGGGGSFGFIVQEHFSKGSTGPCATFNNPRLIRDPSGCFEIVDLEVYGLKSCLFEGSFDHLQH